MNVKEIIQDKFAMTIDEVIAMLQEAKEHGISGKSKVLAKDIESDLHSYIINVEYDSNKTIITYG